MSLDDVFDTATQTVLRTFSGSTLTYVGSAGTQSVCAHVYEESGLFGLDAGIGATVTEPRHLCVIAREDVDAPRRGDWITDHRGVQWSLSERVDGDDYSTTWTVERR